MKKLKTISLSGKAYAQVAERLRAIHEDHKDFDIVTSYAVIEGGVTFLAVLTIRDKQIEESFVTVTYTGHSYGKLGGAKAFEKLETIAVGRALAFAGYHADGEIASADEMQDMGGEVDKEALNDALRQLGEATTVAELNKRFKALPLELQHHKDIIGKGKETKKALTTIDIEK